MADARLPGRWITNAAYLRLTDRAWRAWTYGLMQAALDESDGFIDRMQSGFLYPGGLPDGVADELVAAGLWEQVEGGWLMPGWTTTLGQTAHATLEASRENHRARQRRYQAKVDAAEGVETTQASDLTRQVTSQMTRRVTGKVVVIGAAAGEATISNWELNFKHPVHVIGQHLTTTIQQAPEIFAATLEELRRLIKEGVYPPGTPSVYDLADGPKVLAELEARATVGKLALKP